MLSIVHRESTLKMENEKSAKGKPLTNMRFFPGWKLLHVLGHPATNICMLIQRKFLPPMKVHWRSAGYVSDGQAISSDPLILSKTIIKNSGNLWNLGS